MLNMIIDKILNNRNDLIEGTFCYELFENRIYNNFLFTELIKNIESSLIQKSSLNENDVNALLDFIVWFVMNTMHCIICHNDKNDSYFIENMDMDLWYESHENMLRDVLSTTLKNK